jgi:HEAT repeat protein
MNAGPDPQLQQAASRPESDPFPVQRTPDGTSRRRIMLVGAAFLILLVVGTGSAQPMWQRIAEFIGLRGKPEPASANVLSEHEIAELDNMSPQSQAALLLERSINHYRGANDQIAARVDRWRGKIQLDQQLNPLFSVALNSDDLRVRAAAIEVDLASYNVDKNSASIESLENAARFGEQASRVDALWKIALLGNRGVDPGRAFEIVSASIHDSNENIRYWAVEGLAYLGTDDTIEPLLSVFHDDPSANIRERGACGLAQSGMLSEKQRRKAVPKLLDFADDPSLDPQTREWVFQALRDITGQTLPHDAAAWQNWYAHNNDVQWNPVTYDGR